MMQYSMRREIGLITQGAGDFLDGADIPNGVFPYSIVSPSTSQAVITALLSNVPVLFGSIGALFLRWWLIKYIRTISPQEMSPSTRILNLAFIKVRYLFHITQIRIVLILTRWRSGVVARIGSRTSRVRSRSRKNILPFFLKRDTE